MSGCAMQLCIIYQDDCLVGIEKPAGFHVHPPEDQAHRISQARNCLFILGRQLDRRLYPVHRLDRATSGVLIFALSPEAASSLGRQFAGRTVSKTYIAVARGWLEDRGIIDHPLRSEKDPTVRRESRTEYETITRLELPVSIGPHPSARYTLARVRPLTGRMHQIRRHFRHISHPLIGDSIYGDGAHNRLFREKLGGRALLLKAQELGLVHPSSGEELRLRAKWGQPWHQVFDLFGVCPVGFPSEPV